MQENLHELLREFAGYTPQPLVRLIADGATAVVWATPNVVGVVFYSLLVGTIIEKATTLAGAILRRLWLSYSAQPHKPIGTRPTRAGAYLPFVAGNLLKAWIGVPVLYVLSLVLSDDHAAREELSRLVSGYAWQEAAIAQIPLHTWLNFSHASLPQLAISVAVAFVYMNNVYVHYANGFFLTRQIRAAGDLLFPIAGGSGANLPTRERVAANLTRLGWSNEAVQSALWFLFLNNMRIQWDNPAYRRFSPRQYGLIRAFISLGIIMTLKELHPLVAALKVYFEKHDIGETRHNFALYRKHVARLPGPVQAKLEPAELPGRGAG